MSKNKNQGKYERSHSKYKKKYYKMMSALIVEKMTIERKIMPSWPKGKEKKRAKQQMLHTEDMKIPILL